MFVEGHLESVDVYIWGMCGRLLNFNVFQKRMVDIYYNDGNMNYMQQCVQQVNTRATNPFYGSLKSITAKRGVLVFSRDVLTSSIQ